MVSAAVNKISPLPRGWVALLDRPFATSLARWRSPDGSFVYLYASGAIAVQGTVALDELQAVLRHAAAEHQRAACAEARL